MSNLKIHMSLAFEDNKSRIEPNDPGEYNVHLEDYESLNDLIRRSIRTKTKFVPDGDKNALYDDVLDDLGEEFENILNEDRSDGAAEEQDKEASKAERSEAQEAEQSGLQQTADAM